ncbi:nuclear transport factor 2 family protein [Nonomuraea sp. NPDC059194]|uniref:nuclear transport factor 2 family protein n=1 Tax=Nonomuraea sp. NPDC059194 TaxID=3346764 RepID=UPI0036A89F07
MVSNRERACLTLWTRPRRSAAPSSTARISGSAGDTLVFIEGPRWQPVGKEAVAQGWRAFADSPATTGHSWVSGPNVRQDGDLAVVNGIVHLGRDEEATRLRITWVLTRAEDRWLVVHEHASQPVPDPWGIGGDWLHRS